MKRGLLLSWICIICLTGCASFDNFNNYNKVNIFENADENDRIYANFISRSHDNMRGNLALYKSKLLYSELEGTKEIFYILDFQTNSVYEAGTIENFALRGRSLALAKDVLYFYVTVYDDQSLVNVLYAYDFVTNELYQVSQNDYAKKVIPLISFDNKLYALQGNQVHETYDSFLEILDEDGNPTRITVKQNDVGVSKEKNIEHRIIYVDSDEKNILALEGVKSEEGNRYYYTKYTSDYKCIYACEISSIFEESTITEQIGLFYAFGDYFMITDFSGASILCRCSEGEVEILLCESDLEYVVNQCRKREFEYFYVRRTNDIYRLNLHTGLLERQEYRLENEKSVIRSILAYKDTLLIEKITNGEDDIQEILYLLPLKI